MSSISAASLEAHCRRVAGWATQATHNLDCSTEEIGALERAALWHQHPAFLIRAEAFARLVSELRIEIVDTKQSSPFAGLSLPILRAFHSRATSVGRANELAGILEWADWFDEQFELQALDPLPADLAGEMSAAGLPNLRVVDAGAVLRAGHMLPVFPTVAQRAMRLLAVEDAGFEQLEAILRTDQVLAAELLKIANSAFVGPREPITTLRRAIEHVGVETTTRVVCAVCLRPVFASRNLFDLWKHSIEAAEVAERFALVSERVDPGEAFLAGLVHDIGRLAFSLLSCNYQTQAQRLAEYGCQPVLIEQALSGTTHAEVGAELLRAWAVPARIADAVAAHHDPRESACPLTSLLYLTEFSTMSDEDLPSAIKLERALRVLDLPLQLVMAPSPRASSALSRLRLVA